MKTPEEIKKGLAACKSTGCCTICPYHSLGSGAKCIPAMSDDSFAYIQQLESTYSQVSKALCGKENADVNELLQAVDQLKADLQRERGQNQYTVDAANVMKDEALKLESRLAQMEINQNRPHGHKSA